MLGVLFWSEYRDSHPRPLGPEPSAIPNFAIPRLPKYYIDYLLVCQVYAWKMSRMHDFTAISYDVSGGVGMAYKIQYSQETDYRYPQVKSTPKLKLGKLVCIVLILAAVLWMRLNGVPDFLIPGDPQVTKAAAITMFGDLQDGVSMNKAVTTFCEAILDGAGF